MSPSNNRRVVARPNRGGNLVIAAMLLVFAGSAVNVLRQHPSWQPDQWQFLAVVAVLFGAGTVAALWSAFSMKAIADEHQLRWRHWLRWNHVEWGDVSDYYITSHRKGLASRAVETSADTLELDDSWIGAREFRTAVMERAHRVAYPRWELRGVRPTDPWPRQFRYRNPWRRVLRGPEAAGFLICLTYLLYVPLFWSKFRRMEFPDDAMPMLIFIIGSWLLALGLLSWPLLTIMRDLRHRRNQRITATPDAIIYEDGGTRIEALWTDIQETRVEAIGRILKLPGRRHMVNTRQGSFDFTTKIEDAHLLRRLIELRTENHLKLSWIDATIADEKPEANEIHGSPSFHYRSDAMRSMLHGAFAFTLLIIGLALYRFILPRPGQAFDRMNLVMGGGAPIAYLIFWKWYRTAEIRIDDHGLVKASLLGERRISWADIEDYYRTTNGTIVLKGRSGTLRFSDSVRGQERLMKVIGDKCGARGLSGAWETRPQ